MPVVSAALASALGAALLTACSGSHDQKGAADTPAASANAAGGASARPFTIAMIGKASTNPVFLSARQGAEHAADSLSKVHNVPIKIDWRTPPQEDGQLQAQRIMEAVNDGDNAILISVSDAGKCTSAINDAVARGVPVMTFDSDAPQSKRFAFYGGDSHEIGQQTMDELAAVIHGKGNVAILGGNQNAPNLQLRVQGAKDAAAKYPGIHVVGAFYHVEIPQDAAAEVVRVQNANPQITAWAFIGGWPLWTRTLITQLDTNKVKIVSVDALPSELDYLDKGLVPVLLAQPTYDWGVISVGMIVDHVMLKKDVPSFVKMPLIRVTKDSLGSWARRLKGWGFTDVDPRYLAMH
jgi:ribose transport system substrate-binding protein